MSIHWTTKEKLVLLSDILEYGEQPESWLNISNDLLKTFQNHYQLSQVKLEHRYSIKNCKQEYRILVDRYKSEWIEQQSIHSFKYSLPKFISIQLKSIYQNELTIQLNESRRKLTEFCLQLESLINNKTHKNDSVISTSLNNETSSQSILSRSIEQNNSNLNHLDQISQSNENPSELILEQPIGLTISSDEINQRNPSENFKEEIGEFSSIASDRSKVNEQINNQEIEENSNENSNLTINSSTNEIYSTQMKINENLSSSNKETISSNNSILTSMEIDGISLSSSFSTKINSETKIESIRSTGTTSTSGTKYHVYFSPKNSTNTSTNHTNNHNKIKQKKRSNDDTKDEIDNESTSGSDPSVINSTESSKLNQISSSASQINQNSTTTTNVTAPMTRRSVNTRLVPNNIAEQEEEKSRRFSAMLAENPNSWQSQANSIILYLLSQKQGYLFEFEITDEIAPKYHQFVRKPIALDTIRKNLESNLYLNKDYFKRDIYLMLYNAMKYNPRNHHVHRSAKHLFNQTYPLFQLSVQEIQAQITRRNSISSFSNTTIETPSTKRKRIK